MTEKKETPKRPDTQQPESKEPRVMESALEKIEKARKPDSH